MVSQEQIKAIGGVLNNKERPLKERFRALFTLKNIGGATAIGEISQGFKDESALLKHELAYCLGQMQDKLAIGILTHVLEDTSEEPMVRHEAAEALGAIGDAEILPLLEKYKNDSVVEVAETCLIALERIRWLQSGQQVQDTNPYASVDPSPPAAGEQNVQQLKEIYLNAEQNLFNRYRAMFSLRNLRTEESVLAIAEGLKDKSALFRHEVAFVLGQLQQPCSIKYLQANLEDREENEMVRHECAEALGAIATDQCIQILKDYAQDERRVVKESCIIALDMCEYENSPEFQYADGLTNLDGKK
ncbi:deoxyhypusine hydroxylase [Drosophila grimshawi]|uniref:Deoxyhypusine hydroxylase n=1 Tax=Drosophila grimshawi TaxID=7222 RepID=B4JXY7_DROGR|nr:deoxyhypusine hydroxylase [Drosophila grimshawi]EDV90549.1 GH14125 [Drosophila grimshawi]